MADQSRRGARARRPSASPDPPARYLDLATRQYVDTTRTSPSARIVPSRPAAAPAVREVAGRTSLDTARADSREAPSEPAPTRRQFEAEHQRLLRGFADSPDNPGSFRCQGCAGCANCMFCTDCEGCYRCTHCSRCRESSHLTHCEECRNCHASSYCLRCTNCVGSSYLVLCQSCSDCTYCFGCVGLQKKDFHILNVKYTKTEYFRIVKALRAELGL